MFKEGCVNGRFQPPHKGHLEYILGAKSKCEFLWIGITRYDILDNIPCEVASHRASDEANPFTYHERTVLISTMLLESGIERSSFSFVPFPIDSPDRIPQFVPKEIPIFTTIYDEWNRHKVDVLTNRGYNVLVLWEREVKQFVGHEVRQAIKNNSEIWKEMVPDSLVPLMSQMRARLS